MDYYEKYLYDFVFIILYTVYNISFVLIILLNMVKASADY